MNQTRQDEIKVETEILREELRALMLSALEPIFKANRERAKLASQEVSV